LADTSTRGLVARSLSLSMIEAENSTGTVIEVCTKAV